MARKRELPPIEIGELQKEIALFFEQEFPERHKSYRRHIPIYKVVEAVGEITASLYTERTDRSHDPLVEQEFQKQAVGVAIIYLMEYACRNGWNPEYIIREVWELIHGEDFNPYPDVGRPKKEEDPLTSES